MPSPTYRVLIVCAATLAAALSGCSADRLSLAAPAQAPHLAGNWHLDAAHSERIDAAVGRLESQLRAHMRKLRRAARRAEAQPSTPPARRDGDADEGAPARSEARHSTVQEPSVEVSAPSFGAAWIREFIGHVPVGNDLGIALTPAQFTLSSASGAQQCSLGVPTSIAFGRHDTASQSCGWRGHAFLIELQPLLGPRLSERFEIAPDGELVMTLHMAGHGIDVRLVRRYRRTARGAPQTLLPTSD